MRLFQPERLRAPRDFVRPDGRVWQGRVALEIGAGVGLHALTFAQTHRDTHLIAIERTREKYLTFGRQAERAALANLSAIHADAVAWMVHAVPPASLSQVFIWYPNPEPKNPAQRFARMPFFEFLLSRLEPLGTISMASNSPAYADEAEAWAREVWGLTVARERVAADAIGRTHFERKYLARGECCSELLLERPLGHPTRFDQWCITGQ